MYFQPSKSAAYCMGSILLNHNLDSILKKYLDWSSPVYLPFLKEYSPCILTLVPFSSLPNILYVSHLNFMVFIIVKMQTHNHGQNHNPPELLYMYIQSLEGPIWSDPCLTCSLLFLYSHFNSATQAMLNAHSHIKVLNLLIYNTFAMVFKCLCSTSTCKFIC